MHTHDALLRSANENDNEGMHLGVLGDYLEENEMPGAYLARAGMKGREFGFQRLYNRENIETLRHPLTGADRLYTVGDGLPGDVSVEAVHRLNPIAEPRSPAYLRVVHHGVNDPTIYTEYRLPVFSQRHLDELTSDLPEHTRRQLRDTTEGYIPADHVAEQMSRRSRARKLSRRLR